MKLLSSKILFIFLLFGCGQENLPQTQPRNQLDDPNLFQPVAFNHFGENFYLNEQSFDEGTLIRGTVQQPFYLKIHETASRIEGIFSTDGPLGKIEWKSELKNVGSDTNNLENSFLYFQTIENFNHPIVRSNNDIRFGDDYWVQYQLVLSLKPEGFIYKFDPSQSKILIKDCGYSMNKTCTQDAQEQDLEFRWMQNHGTHHKQPTP